MTQDEWSFLCLGLSLGILIGRFVLTGFRWRVGDYKREKTE